MPHPIIGNDAIERAVVDYIVRDPDPYSATVAVLATALETVLQDRVSGSMSEDEYDSLTRTAVLLVTLDPAVRISIDPQPGGED